jgi:uncharacterized protein (TIGR02996 family)
MRERIEMNPTGEEATFLAAIAAEPDDDTTRLVYADWLEEHEQAERADAIRRGVKKPKRFTFGEGAAAQVAYTSKRKDLQPAGSLWPNIVCVTLAPGYAGVSWTTYKGLLESATCTWQRWLEVGDGLLKRNWCPEVVLTTLPHLNLEEHTAGGRIFSIPRRPGRHLVRDGESHRGVVLSQEWPAVTRWQLPSIVTHLRQDNGLFTGINALDPDPQVGDVVRLADGSQGILLAPIDAEGRAPVRPVSRG